MPKKPRPNRAQRRKFMPREAYPEVPREVLGFKSIGEITDKLIADTIAAMPTVADDRRPLVVTREQFDRFKAAGYPERQMVVSKPIKQWPGGHGPVIVAPRYAIEPLDAGLRRILARG